MSYEFPNKSESIKQGDIFHSLPYSVVDPLKLNQISDDKKLFMVSWDSIKDNESTKVLIPLKPVWGIVASQNCDIEHNPYISFFVVDDFIETTNLTPPKKKKTGINLWWAKIVPMKTRRHAWWFYLPENEKIGFSSKMVADYRRNFLVERSFLEQNREKLRKGRLNELAYQHYRERIAQFFRRYPYDEWYPLNKEELKEYNGFFGRSVKPYKWQE